jgi:hypothetical protein
MKLILHVGIEKTGTSAIQATLYHNRKSLLRQGVLYPVTGLWNDFSHHKLSFSLKSTSLYGEYPDRENLVRAFLKEAGHAKCETVIVSSEILREFYKHHSYSWFIRKCKNIFQTIEIAIFLREQSEWLCSMYNQWVKDPVQKYSKSSGDFVEFFKDMADFEKLVKGWMTSEGIASVKVGAYDSNTKAFDLNGNLKNFIGICGLNFTMNGWDLKRKIVNPSLDRPVFDLIRHFNRFELSENERIKLLAALRPIFINNYTTYNESVFPVELTEMIKNRYRMGNEILIEMFDSLRESNIFTDRGIKSDDREDYNGVTVHNLSKLVMYLLKNKI